MHLTVHGPVLTPPRGVGPAISVDWMGSRGSPDVAVLSAVGAAANYRQFRAAVSTWHAPALTFVYADVRGNIGAVTAGDFPLIRHGVPWLPLAGSGADDMTGVIPFQALPHAYNPPGHVIATGGQPPVTAAYPYYLGTSANDLDVADSAGAAYAILGRRSSLSPTRVVSLQTSPANQLAVRVLPRLFAALKHPGTTQAEHSAAAVLRGWNHQMAASSAAAGIWAVFWADFVRATFWPWWRAAGASVGTDPASLQASAGQAGLSQAVANWTLADPSNPVFTPPGVRRQAAASVMRAAFAAAVW